MEKGVLHIELMNRPVPRVSQSEDSANCSGLDNRIEHFIIVNTGALGETTKDPASLVYVQRAIGMELLFEYLFFGDHIGLGRPRNEIPSVVVHKSSIFVLHGLTPVAIGKSMTTGSHIGDRASVCKARRGYRYPDLP